MTSSSATLCCAIFSGSTWICSMRRRSPQMAMFATPATLSSRGRIVQYEIIDMSISECSSEVSPIFMTRLVAERGCRMTGGLAHVGSVGVTAAIRSATSWRASSRFPPRSKISSIEDTSRTDFERITSRPSIPASACSSGTVTRDSTSAADSPSDGVWTSTRGGANSGRHPPGRREAARSRTPSCRRRKPAPGIETEGSTEQPTASLLESPHRLRSLSTDQWPPPTPVSAPYSSAAPVATTAVSISGPVVSRA